ncbi:MAG: hypothetical protein H5T69_21460, partial [Chloroflexi bacterium]|nr:hypothetical protein [Chloroflexota bacterium]
MLEEMGLTLSAELTINKYDAQSLISSLQGEIDAMSKAVASAKGGKSWRDSVITLQGNAWQSRASSFLQLLNEKIKATSQPDPDEVVLAKIFLWKSQEDVSAYRASSALIRGDFQSPALQPFPTLHIPSSKKITYLWNWARWQNEGSFERLNR